MSSKFRPDAYTETSSASIAWSISFGDLLTLLVCFFLVLTQQGLVFPGDPAKDEPLTSPAGQVHGRGTELASQHSKGSSVPPVRVVITGPSAGEQESWELVQEINAAVSKLLERADGVPGQCAARLCSSSGREAVASQMSTLFRRSRQLCSSWELETGFSCDGERKGAQRDVIAIVEFSVT
jgi:hypothetical protein